MDINASIPPSQQRLRQQANSSSKPNLFKSLVSPTSGPLITEATTRKNQRTKSVPLLPADYAHSVKAKALGERQGNVQSPPSSPSRSRQKSAAAPRAGVDTKVPSKDGPAQPKKSKPSTNLSAVFTKMNRSSKDLTARVERGKENTTPPSSSNGPVNTPIWAQFASNAKPLPSPDTRDSKVSANLQDEIARYTPQEYSPSKQRNFNGTAEDPALRPTLGRRPHSAYVLGTEVFAAAVSRRVSGGRASVEGRMSEEGCGKYKKEHARRVSGDEVVSVKLANSDRKVSASSTEQEPAKEKLTIAKRGGRVMAAVAALQGKRSVEVQQEEPGLDPKVVDEAFEAVLDSRNVPEPMRPKMRSLTLQVKADFIKQDQGSKTASTSPTGTLYTAVPEQKRTTPGDTAEDQVEENSKASKRSRPRSRTFTFSKGDKRGDASPSKKQRSQSKSRPLSIHIPKETSASTSPSTPATPKGSFRKATAPAVPADYIAYLRKNQDPTKTELGRLHKLRILLRNETVAWVDSFVSLGGLTEIVDLLHRTMAVEWREEHEDQLLHETLLCLKGLCTTERAMAELDKVADELFPALMGMLFDDEKKGPAEYSTRTIIINVLFNFHASASSTSPALFEQRAHRILSFLGEPRKSETDRAVDFVLDMHASRPYRLWCREVTQVTKEVFWIFLHHMNVVPLPKASAGNLIPSSTSVIEDLDAAERMKVLASTYTQRHFPGARPPVPAAPYIGGVEWDATTYLTAHLDLINGLIASISSAAERNVLRAEMQASGFEKVMGSYLRTCKEKFYSGIHDGLRSWAAAAAEDGWDTRFVREGPTQEEQAARAKSASPKKSPKKKQDEAPKLDAPKLDLKLDIEVKGRNDGNGKDVGWLG